jgi:DNA-binding NtrC family response regulator
MKKLKRVLLVEDHNEWSATLNELMTELNCVVNVESNYIDALVKFESINYDLVVIDLSLGEDNNRDGLILLEDAYRKGVPSIVVSGLATLEDVKKAKRYDALRVFQKRDFKINEFRKVVREIVKKASSNTQDFPEKDLYEINALLRKFVSGNHSDT